jgi:hypothetical protein
MQPLELRQHISAPDNLSALVARRLAAYPPVTGCRLGCCQDKQRCNQTNHL